MNKVLEKLNSLGKGTFQMISDNVFKSEKADALVLGGDLEYWVNESIKLEIPYIDNEILKKFLPEKFQNDFILNEYKELAKFDHSILSTSIFDFNLFKKTLIPNPLSNEYNPFISNLLLPDSKVEYIDFDMCIFLTEVEEFV